MPERTLTDADIEAISDKLIEKMQSRFYVGVGRGVFDWIFKALIGVVIGFGAAYYNR